MICFYFRHDIQWECFTYFSATLLCFSTCVWLAQILYLLYCRIVQWYVKLAQIRLAMCTHFVRPLGFVNVFTLYCHFMLFLLCIMYNWLCLLNTYSSVSHNNLVLSRYTKVTICSTVTFFGLTNQTVSIGNLKPTGYQRLV